MFKRSWIAAALFAAQMAAAAQYDYELSPMVGIDIPEGNILLENEKIIGGEFQFNHLFDFVIKPELSVYYATDTDYTEDTAKTTSGQFGGTTTTMVRESTKIWRVGAGGVYDYAMSGPVRPFAKIGIGYENMETPRFDNKNSLYADAGLGAKFPITDQVAFKAEAIYMLKSNDARYDSNLMLLAGLNFAFGGGAAAAAPVAAATGYKRTDSDGDGVYDENDQCPDTPHGFGVDTSGCELSFVFNVQFDTDSAVVSGTDMAEIDNFVAFMKNNAYRAQIVGRADDRGTNAYNLTLSKKRAEAVTDILIDKGIASDRLEPVAKGEEDPIAPNTSDAGRAENRSVRAVLIR